jgi:hypothetical protein
MEHTRTDTASCITLLHLLALSAANQQPNLFMLCMLQLSALLVAQEQWDLLEIPVEVRKAAKLASQRANEADQNKNQKGQEQKQQQEDHQMNVTTISPAGTPGSALQEEQMMQQQEGNQGAANITTSTDSISSSSAVITSSSNAGSTQEVEDQWLTAALNDVMPVSHLFAASALVFLLWLLLVTAWNIGQHVRPPRCSVHQHTSTACCGCHECAAICTPSRHDDEYCWTIQDTAMSPAAIFALLHDSMQQKRLLLT